MTVISLTKKKDLSIINIDDGKVDACCVKLLTELTDAITSVDNNNRVLCLTGRPGFFFSRL